MDERRYAEHQREDHLVPRRQRAEMLALGGRLHPVSAVCVGARFAIFNLPPSCTNTESQEAKKQCTAKTLRRQEYTR